MKICIIGTGYVGLVTGTCFAEMGNLVTCVDTDQNKINSLLDKKIPIYEPGLEPLVISNLENNRINFTTNIAEGLKDADVCFIAVGTPSGEDGSADLTYVLNVAQDIGTNMEKDLIVVDKSTVPVGTADKVKDTISEELKRRNLNLNLIVASNPEFLKEGAAVQDFMKPDRVIIGVNEEKGRSVLKQLYSPFVLKNDRIQFMSPRDAEMTKYVANSLLATKISFMNEISNLCEVLDVDVESVRKGIGSDSRIGYSFIYPGCGYGGSCFPKDVKALIKTGNDNNVNLGIIKEVENRNSLQKEVLFNKVKRYLGPDLKNKVVSVWGLSFKPGTDDLREAPSFNLIEELINSGATVLAYDPIASDNCKKEWPKSWFESNQLQLMNSSYETLTNSEALILVTEWKEFRSPDFTKMKNTMERPLILDGRNQYDPSELKSMGFEYEGIGRAV